MSDTLEGYRIDLDEKRHVFVARHEGLFWIQFCDADGYKTRMKLSMEAGEALRYLLRDEIPKTEDTIKAFMMHIALANPETESRFEWREVKPHPSR